MAKPTAKPKKAVPKKGPGGRPKFEPTEENRGTVRAMIGYGVPQADIAKVLKIAPKTLRAHFRDEIDLGAIVANAKIAETMYKKAVAGDNTLLIWWSKTRMGWKETTVLEGDLTVSEIRRKIVDPKH